MQSFLQELVVGNIYAFLLIFMRFGLAMMIMPGIGDGFVTPTVRLLFALAVSFVLTPVLSPNLPVIPPHTGALIVLLTSEAFIGLFIGTVMRIMVSALDTAGSIASVQSGLSNATLLNPMTEAQGTVMSAIYSSLGVTLLLMSDLHHQMLASIVDSYRLFPASAAFPDMGAIAEVVGKTVTVAFKIGVQLAIPFLVVGTLLQVGFGMLGRLIPQIQIFFLAMPLQIFLSLITLLLVLSAGVMFWLNGYESILLQSFSPE